MKRTPATAVLTLVLTALALPSAAQETGPERSEATPAQAEALVAFFNSPGTIRFSGRARIPAGRVVEGDVGVLGGPVVVGGEVRGDLVVLNGDLTFEETGRVRGDVTVAGGEIVRSFGPSVAGTTTVFDEPLRYRERAGRVELAPRPEASRDVSDLLRISRRTRFMIRTGGSYNRVEGLPVMFGPVIETGGRHPFRADLLARWRTEAGLTLNDELGWTVMAEQQFGGFPRLALRGSFHSRIDPISEIGLSSVESSLAAFAFHKDFRDYYEREGWSAGVSIDLDRRLPVSLAVDFRDEEHAFAPVSSPWTIRRNDDPWRPQPLVAEGDIQTLSTEVVLDTRNDPDQPSDGWLVTGRLTRGLDGDLATPDVFERAEPELSGPVPGVPVDATFTAGFLDVKRYNRLGPDTELSLRALYTGSIDGEPVPSQYQTALGGEGSLPGYGLYSIDCGARRSRVHIRRTAFDDDADRVQPAFPSFGCDRTFLFQAELRGRFGIHIDIGSGDDDGWTGEGPWYPVIDLDPSWVAFVDVGRGRSESDPTLDTDTFTDVGLGFFLGDLGFYWAVPLDDPDDRGVNFFVRLQRRF